MNTGDLGIHLSEQHQFYLALIAQVISSVNMFLLYRSAPNKPHKPGDPPPELPKL